MWWYGAKGSTKYMINIDQYGYIAEYAHTWRAALFSSARAQNIVSTRRRAGKEERSSCSEIDYPTPLF